MELHAQPLLKTGSYCFAAANVKDFIQDPVTRTLVFYSSCDPLGTNPFGGQLFAMRPDGSGLRQLTDTPGLVIEADGTVDTTLPGPFWYSGQRY